MSQQSLDFRRSIGIVRRRKLLVGLTAGLGLFLGVADATLSPALLSSQALVVLPQSSANVSTELVIVSSDPVLTVALKDIQPAMSVQTLRQRVNATSLTSNIMSITVQGRTADEAEAAANAVAQSFISYVGSSSSPVGHVSAHMLEPAQTAQGGSQVKHYLTPSILGLIGGLLVGVIISLVLSQRDRRLRQRDEIANAIGIPVIASVPVARPSDAAGWTKILDDYEPGVLNAWRLRRALQHLDLLGTGNGAASLTVLSLSSDPGALAMGPELAAFAASIGIPTNLVVGPQQDPNVTATLQTACEVNGSADRRSSNLLTTVSEDGRPHPRVRAALTVVVIVVDPRSPEMPRITPTRVTTLAVSAGKSTAEQLARVAVAAAASGREISGIFVANPESSDRTTGRVPYLPRSVQRRLPSRLVDVPTESRR
jgi:capsular polysaccharide biosynthesis protein